MGWADRYIEELKAGRAVKFRPRGKSMSGLIEDGQLVTVAPLVYPVVESIVLCKVNGKQYLHRLIALDRGMNRWIKYKTPYLAVPR